MTVMTVMSFSNGDDNNHDFCGNDGQLCDVRDMMILKCTNILPPPPQHHNSNITNFFYKWLFSLVYWSKDCRLPVVLMQASSSKERQLWETRAAPRPTYLWSGTCPLQLRAYTQIPSCRRISSGLIAQVALLPNREEVRSVLGVTPSWDRGGWWVWPSDWNWVICICHIVPYSDPLIKLDKLPFVWWLTNWLGINRNFGVWLCRFPRGVQVQTTHWFDIIITLCFGKHLHSYDKAGWRV